jgi:hypothetical protein
MADLSITAANVLRGSNARVESGVFGATVTQGQVVYRDAADGKFKLADCDSGTAAAKIPYGIALNGGAAGQPADVQISGDITIGGTLTAGAAYYLSPNPGGIGLIAEVGVGDDYTLLGLATSTSVLRLGFIVSGVTRAS